MAVFKEVLLVGYANILLDIKPLEKSEWKVG